MRLAPLALAALSVSLAAGIALAGDLAKAKNDLDAALKNVAAAKSEEDKDRAYDELRSACAPFSSEDSKEVPILLLDRAAKNDDAMARYFLRGTAAGVRGKLALEALGKAIVERQKDTDLALDLVKGIAGTSEGTAALAFVLEKGSTAVQKAAIARLGTFPTVESLDALVAALGRGDRELETPLRSELVTIAGEDKGKAPAWAAWWNEQRKSGVPERKAPPPAPPPAADGGKKPPRHVIVLADSGPRSKPDEGDADTDRIQDVLAKHDFPHVVVKRGDFAKDPDMYMNECYVLLLNCHGLEHPLPRAALDRIKSWVENGGYLYTEDSDLVGVTGALWPDRIDAGQPGKPGPLARKPGSAEGSFEAHFPVRLVPAKGITSHPLLRGALRKDAVHMFPKWEVQDRVPAIVVKDRSVVVLLEAPELAPLAQNNTAAAITFAVQADKPDASKPLRRGRVLHVLAHYGQQDSRQDNQALDNVLLNFLLEATKKR